MNIDDAIMLSIIGGHHRFEKILSAAHEKCKMSRASFDKHLKQLVQDKYIIKKDDGKTIEYHVNPSNNDKFLEFKDDENLNHIIIENEKVLDPNMGMLYAFEPEYFEDVIRLIHNHISTSLKVQRKRTVLLNLVDTSKSLQNKHKKELEKLNTVIKQSLQILHKVSPEISKEYEKYLLKKVSEEDLYNIQDEKKFKGEKIYELFLKRYKK